MASASRVDCRRLGQPPVCKPLCHWLEHLPAGAQAAQAAQQAAMQGEWLYNGHIIECLGVQARACGPPGLPCRLAHWQLDSVVPRQYAQVPGYA